MQTFTKKMPSSLVQVNGKGSINPRLPCQESGDIRLFFEVCGVAENAFVTCSLDVTPKKTWAVVSV